MPPLFAFRTDVDSPMGQSLRDAQLGYVRAVKELRKIISMTPPVRRVDRARL